MANSDKNIVITPNKGSSSEDPKIEFSGANSSIGAQTITARVYPTSNGTLSFEGSAGQLFSITNSLSGTIFSVNDVSGIPSFQISDTGDITLAQYSGNVGIGTSSPVTQLHVASNGSQTPIFAIPDATNSRYSVGIGSYNVLGIGQRMDFYVGDSGTNGVNLTSASLRMSIDSSGNVGIGTSSPSRILQVTKSSGDVIPRFNAATGYYVGLELTENNSLTSGEYWQINKIPTTHGLQFWNGAERMRIDSSGNVGIGTSSPDTVLTVKTRAAAGFAALKVEDYSDTSGVYTSSVTAGNFRFISGDSYYYNSGAFRSNNTTSAVVNMYNGELKFYTDSGLTANTNFFPTERMRIDSSGNVGIGTSSPQSKLNVYGSAGTAVLTLSDSTLGVNYGSQLKGYGSTGIGGFGEFGVLDAGTYSKAITVAFQANYVAFNTGYSGTSSNAERMRIDASGNVGIGTSSPSYKLDISGTGYASSDFRAPIFYDSNNTAYYLDPSGVSGSNITTIYTDNWFRSYGTTGWVNQDYGGGIYMIDTTWVRTYNSKAFYVANQIAATGNITAYYSDERLKTRTGKIENALQKVLGLDGFHYVENELAKSLGYSNSKQQVGLSAQQVQSVLPEAVSLAPVDMHTDEFSGEITSKSGENYLTVDYSRLVPLLVEAIKQQQTQIDKLNSLVGRLSNETLGD
jgi:hypothetical protein